MSRRKEQKTNLYHKKGSYFFLVSMLLLTLTILVITCSFSRTFCEWYTLHIYRGFADILSRLTDHIPFLLGEWIMYLFFILMIGFLLTFLVIILDKRKKYRRFVRTYQKTVLIFAMLLLFSFGLNYLLLLRTTPLTFGTDPGKVYSIYELQELCNQMTIELNRVCKEIKRGENGYPVVPENMEELVKSAMTSLEEEFPAFGTNCPNGKFASCSDFMEWMDIGGFTYPYTSEVCLNRYTDLFYYPHLYAHELTHHFGYFRENEGNFFSYLALIRSEDLFLQYSGYYNAYVYVASAYQENLKRMSIEDAEALDAKRVKPDPQIRQDAVYFYDLSVVQYEENVNTGMEQAFSGVSSQIADVGWNVQDVMLDEATYDGVVELLLRYYDEK